jgi:hypothetical protein
MLRLKLLFVLSMLLAIMANAQIVNHAWPKESKLISNQKYEIKVRVYDPVSQFAGEWIALDVFLSIPRDYPTHWKVQDDAMTAFMKDRTLSFVSFDFEGYIEVEVTQKLSSKNAEKVELSPKAFGFNPHYFDGKTVRFYMDRPEYVSVNFDFGKSDISINRDDNRASGLDIKHGCMIFTETPEKKITDYTVPKPGDPGVVVWDNNTDLSTILNANIIYFPPGEHEMRNHKDRWERNSSWDFAEREGNWVTTKAEYDNAKLYRGRLFLGKNDQKVYIAPGAIVYGGFHSSGKNNNWLYGRGIVTGRKHLMHEVIKPEASTPIAIDKPYVKITQTKAPFCSYGTGAVYDGVLFLEAWHHTCPSGNNSKIRRIKIIGWCSNNDGIRPAGGSVVDRIFVKTSDDIDYARDKKVVRNAVFWPMVNGAMGMLGWNNLGSGYAEYYNTHVINSEWHLDNPSKGNIGIVGGGMAKAGIKLSNNIYQDFHIENRTNYLVLVALSGNGTGFLRNFKLKNITTEYPLSNATGKTVKQELKGVSSTWVENWTFTNVFIDGVLLTWENHKNYFNLNLTGTNGTNTDEPRKVKNIAFNSEGDIYTIQITKTAGGSVRPNGTGGAVQIAKGMKQTIVVEPNEGFKIKSITVDGVLFYEHGNPTATARTPYIVFENVQSNHTVDVSFEAGSDFFDFPHVSLPIKVADASKVKVYPSPTTGMFTVVLPEKANAWAIIYSTDGKQLLSQEIQSGSGVINISNFNTDTYILRIKQNDDYYLTKVTKF